MASTSSSLTPLSGNVGENYAEPNYAKNLASCLNDYRKNRTLCDVVLVVQDNEYMAHRNVLCAASTYFLEQFGTISGQTFGSKHQLHNISSDIFDEVLNFIYIGEICVGEDNVRKLISASDVLHMTDLKDLACRFYEKRLCPSNCLSIASLADEFNCETLRFSADQFILQHFLEVSKFEEFRSLSCPHLIKIISSDDISVESEEQIFYAVMDWVHYDLEARKKHLGPLMGCIRLLRTSKYFISDVLENDEYIISNSECMGVISKAKYLFNFPDRKHLFEERKAFSPRSYSDITKIIIVCGGNQERMSTNEVLCYVPSQDFWYPLAPLHQSRYLSSSVVINNEVYCIGGKIEGVQTKTIEKYCFSVDKWMENFSLPEQSSNHVACIYNGELHVVGGGINETSSAAVYKFSMEKCIWVRMRNLMIPRRNAAVAVHKYLYIIGGYGPDGEPLASVERYDPYLNEWSKIFPMNSARACASAICVGNNIFVFGGEYAMWSYYRSAEVFNILTDEWKSIPDMSLPRSYMGIACFENKIYLVGGMVSADGSDQYGVSNDEDEFVDVNETNMVECYDIVSNSWKKVCSLPVATAGANCSVITASKSLVCSRCGF